MRLSGRPVKFPVSSILALESKAQSIDSLFVVEFFLLKVISSRLISLKGVSRISRYGCEGACLSNGGISSGTNVNSGKTSPVQSNIMSSIDSTENFDVSGHCEMGNGLSLFSLFWNIRSVYYYLRFMNLSNEFFL